MLTLVNTLAFPLRAATAALAAWRSRDPATAAEWLERRARKLPAVQPGGYWIHGASAGEALLVRSISAGLRREEPERAISVSATTRTGRERLPSPPEIDAAFYAPLDFSGYPGRILDAVRPGILVLVETELWPNLVHESAERGIPVAVVNGRLAPERMSRYRRYRALYGPVLARIAGIGAQSDRDADRFLSLGIDPSAVTVTGNLKYDLAAPAVDRGALRAGFSLSGDRKILVAGSTGAGEDGPVLDAFLEAREKHPDLFLILAPRHPARAPEALQEARNRNLDLHPLSSGDDDVAGGKDGLLVDSVGHLSTLYALARAAFVGGSLVPVGGHNVLEPAALGVPVLFGPHTEHTAETAAALEEAGGGLRVGSAGELAEKWIRLVEDDALCEKTGRRAAEVIGANRGALQRTVSLIRELAAGAGGLP